MDDADKTDEKNSTLLNAELDVIHRKAVQIPVGREGECTNCGDYSLRLVKEHCCRCRDKLKLP